MAEVFEFFFEKAKNIDIGKKCCLVMYDIDDFRKINDGMGILEGDEVVQSLGLSYKTLMSEDIIVSHFNSDVYCMAIYDPVGRRSVENVVNQIKDIMKNPITLVGGKEVTLTVSIGVAEYPESTKNYFELINLAEIVMLKAKNKGKNNEEIKAEVDNEQKVQIYMIFMAER